MKCRAWTKNFDRLQNFSHINFSPSRKQRFEQKITLFLHHSSNCLAKNSLQTRVWFPASNFIPKNWLKKGLLQYSSSSRRKTVPQSTSNSMNFKNDEVLNIFEIFGCSFLAIEVWRVFPISQLSVNEDAIVAAPSVFLLLKQLRVSVNEWRLLIVRVHRLFQLGYSLMVTT